MVQYCQKAQQRGYKVIINLAHAFKSDMKLNYRFNGARPTQYKSVVFSVQNRQNGAKYDLSRNDPAMLEITRKHGFDPFGIKTGLDSANIWQKTAEFGPREQAQNIAQNVQKMARKRSERGHFSKLNAARAEYF